MTLVMLLTLSGAVQAQDAQPMGSIVTPLIADDDGNWVPRHQADEVWIHRGETSVLAEADEALFGSDLVVTERGRVELEREGQSFTVYEDTRVVFEDWGITHEIGAVWVQVSSAFTVKWGSTEAVVEGTEFLSTAGEGEFDIRVGEGAVRVRNDLGEVLVGPGEVAEVKEGKAPAKRKLKPEEQQRMPGEDAARGVNPGPLGGLGGLVPGGPSGALPGAPGGGAGGGAASAGSGSTPAPPTAATPTAATPTAAAPTAATPTAAGPVPVADRDDDSQAPTTAAPATTPEVQSPTPPTPALAIDNNGPDSPPEPDPAAPPAPATQTVTPAVDIDDNFPSMVWVGVGVGFGSQVAPDFSGARGRIDLRARLALAGDLGLTAGVGVVNGPETSHFPAELGLAYGIGPIDLGAEAVLASGWEEGEDGSQAAWQFRPGGGATATLLVPMGDVAALTSQVFAGYSAGLLVTGTVGAGVHW